MAFNATEFYTELIKDSKLTDAQKEALQSALLDQTVVKRLEEGQLRQSDYSRQVSEAQAKINEALQFRAQLVEWQKQEQDRLAAERAAFRTNAGIDPDPEPTQPTNGGLTKDELLGELRKMEQGAIGLFSVMNNKSVRHLQEFGEVLDTSEVVKKAQEAGVNFEIAYDLYTKPKREAKAAKELEERIKREREEAAREALANASLPTGNPFQNVGGNPHPLDLRAKEGAQFGWKAAVEAHTKDIMAGTVKHD